MRRRILAGPTVLQDSLPRPLRFAEEGAHPRPKLWRAQLRRQPAIQVILPVRKNQSLAAWFDKQYPVGRR